MSKYNQRLGKKRKIDNGQRGIGWGITWEGASKGTLIEDSWVWKMVVLTVGVGGRG